MWYVMQAMRAGPQLIQTTAMPPAHPTAGGAIWLARPPRSCRSSLCLGVGLEVKEEVDWLEISISPGPRVELQMDPGLGLGGDAGQ